MARIVVDPSVIAAIEGALMLSVYEARRRYRLQMGGAVDPPASTLVPELGDMPSSRATEFWSMFARSRARRSQ